MGYTSRKRTKETDSTIKYIYTSWVFKDRPLLHMQNLTMNTKLLKLDIYIKSLKLSP